MQIPVLNGIYSDEVSDFRTSYPRNLIPVPKRSGISNGYLRPADGIIEHGTGNFGVSQGGINWNDTCYRVMGPSLVKVEESGTITEVQNLRSVGRATLDYSFDYLSVSASGKLFLYDGSLVRQVTDVDLGTVVDHVWVDGYFMATDGEFLVVTELNDPFSVIPTKYGSSEVDPDPVKALLKIRNEPHALNRYTIEAFDNVGGSGFPFQRIDGAQIQRGVIGTHACCVFLDAIAFLGSGRNEPVAFWLGAGGTSEKISTREIDQILSEYTESVLSDVVVEARVDKGHQMLYVHLPDQTLVYDAAASQALGQQVWFTLSSGLDKSQYRMRDMVWCYDDWLVGDTESSAVGKLTSTIATHWGEVTEWQFGTAIAYNEGRGAIFHELELVCLSGRVDLDDDPKVSTEYSLDGESWSMPKYVSAGKRGQRNKRLVWLNQGGMRHWRMQRFTGTSASRLSIARLEARIESLAV